MVTNSGKSKMLPHLYTTRLARHRSIGGGRRQETPGPKNFTTLGSSITHNVSTCTGFLSPSSHTTLQGEREMTSAQAVSGAVGEEF